LVTQRSDDSEPKSHHVPIETSFFQQHSELGAHLDEKLMTYFLMFHINHNQNELGTKRIDNFG